MEWKCFGGSASLALGALVLAGCLGPNDMMASIGSLTAPSGSPQARGWQSLSADYQGELHPASNTRAALTGNTVVFSHPWVKQDMHHIQENGIYFNSDGTADSVAWVKRPWHVDGNVVCIEGEGEKSCFTLYNDETGQAFLFSDELDVLSKVTSVQPGDTLQLASRHDERIREDQASTNAANALVLGGIFGGMAASGSAPAPSDGVRTCNGRVQPAAYTCTGAPAAGN